MSYDGDRVPPAAPLSPRSATPLLSDSAQSRPSSGYVQPSDGALFDGLARGLSDASAEAERRRQSRETSDDEEDQPRQRNQPRRSSVDHHHHTGVGSPGSLASPLMSPTSAKSDSGGDGGGTRRRGEATVLRRHIVLVAGEFHITKHDRAFLLTHQSWFQRTFSPKVERTDLFRDNYVKSSRYEWFNFLPKNLYEQLAPWSKPANFFFLTIAGLQCIKEISTTQGRPSILVPLVFVLTVTAVKDALEDYARHKQDRVKNQAAYFVYREKSWQRVLSKNLLVGDLVKLKDHQRVPADMLLVSSGIENGAYAFVDTKELDGETNLKPKTVAPAFLAHLSREWKRPEIDLQLKCDVPNQIMNAWQGDLTVEGKRENVNLGNFLLTDSVLRNTGWAVGMIVYTGEDTRIRMNMAKQLLDTRQKQSSVFRVTKQLFMFMIITLVIMCFIAAIDSGIRQSYNLDHDVWYQMPDESPTYAAFLRFWTFFIITKDLIPISLYVSLELVQFWQAIFIGWDKKMTKTIHGVEYPASAQTSKLNEELSQVAYCFSDKTGTMTQNSMVFRKCLIGVDSFGTGTTEAGRLRQAKMEQAQRRATGDDRKESDQNDDDDDDEDATGDDQHGAPAPDDVNDLQVPHVEFNESARILTAVHGVEPISTRVDSLSSPSADDLVQLFLYALALNNSVFPKIHRLADEDEANHDEDEKEEDPLEHIPEGRADVTALEEEKEKKSAEQDEATRGDEPVILEASSPDERALVAFAQAMGFELLRRAGGKVELRLQKPDANVIIQAAREAREAKRRREAGTIGDPTMDEEDDDDWNDVVPPLLKPGTYQIEKFDELCLLDFTSKRKRMTVVLHPRTPDGRPTDNVLIFIKGADSALKPLLEKKTPQEKWDTTFDKLAEFGSESLRTLLLGYSIQPASWWEECRSSFEESQRAIGESEKGHVEGACSDECNICAVETKIEHEADFQLLGATAIEDKLADEVPHTLAALRKAGIHTWMLTGDNISTATNIAISCNLLDADMYDRGRLFRFDRELDTPEKIDEHLAKCQRTMRQAIRDHQQQKATRGAPVPTFGLSFHGDVFKILSDEHHHFAQTHKDVPSMAEHAREGSLLDRFFDLAAKCQSCIASRLEPKEKADIVGLMKKRTRKICLAIGDGNNDTPMIKAADIGVGIRGVEGTSAAASSDYAISEFKFLRRLLLVHGRLNYRRISTLILYVFYKSSFLVMTHFLFGAFSQFSGTFMYLDWAVQLHNVLYTAVPIICYAVFDRDLSMETLEAHPHIYSLTRGKVLFNFAKFAQWMFIALCQACLCFFLPMWSFDQVTSPEPAGHSYGIWSSGLCVYTCVVLTTNMRLIWEFQSWTVYHHVSLWGSILAFFAAMCMFSSSPKFAIGGADYFMVFFRLAKLVRFWLIVVVTVWACMMIDLAYHHIIITFYDSPTHRLIEAERIHGPKAVGLVARRLHREKLQREQAATLRKSEKAGGARERRDSHVFSSWDDGQPSSTEAQKNALLNRRGRAAPKGRPTALRSEDEESVSSSPTAAASGIAAVYPPLTHQDSYTGFSFEHTPRAMVATPRTMEQPTAAATAAASSSMTSRTSLEQ